MYAKLSSSHIMPAKVLKIKTSLTGIYLLDLVSYHNTYITCSHLFNIITKPTFSFILFLKFLKL